MSFEAVSAMVLSLASGLVASVFVSRAFFKGCYDEDGQLAGMWMFVSLSLS